MHKSLKQKDTETSEQSQDPRNEMRVMGNKLVELTETLIRKVGTFFNKFNKSFLFVQLDTFIF